MKNNDRRTRMLPLAGGLLVPAGIAAVVALSVKGYETPYPTIPPPSCLPAIRKAGPLRVE